MKKIPPTTRLPMSAISPALRLALLLAHAALATSSADAQDPYHCIDGLSDDGVSYRIREIEQTFEKGREKSLGWRVGWILGQSALFSGQVALAITSARQNRPEDTFAFAYGAAGAGALTLGLTVAPMVGAWGLKRIRRQPSDTLEQRKEKLRYATRLLEKGSKIEGMLGSEKPVVFAVVYGVVGGTVKAVKWTGKSPGLTALLFLGPPALAAVSVVTAPKHLRAEWNEYRGWACSEKYYDRDESEPELNFGLGPTSISFSVEF